MLKTERLYYTDCYLRRFEARVLKVEAGAKNFRVYLDRSAFYPESGGQPTDHGTLAGIPVTEVIDEGEKLAHVLERKPEVETAQGEIDWERRFDHMQQHTGQHVLSAAFEKTGDYKTVSFHLGAQTSTIDLDSDRLGRRQIEEAENLANRVVFENREVRIFVRPPAEASRLDLRKPSERQGEVRLVEVEEFDLSACGGTHVNRTGAIGLIVVRKFERIKGLLRVEFVCGSRALKAARQDFQVLSETARLLSTSPDQASALIGKRSEELRAAVRACEKLAKQVADHQARELVQAAPEQSGRKIVRHIFPSEDHMQAKMAAHAVAGQPSTVVLIGVRGKPATLYFAQSAGGAADMASLLRQTLAKVGGKGGGSNDFAQGGGLEEEKLEEALALAQSLLQPRSRS